MNAQKQPPHYEMPPPWIPAQQRFGNPDYDSELRNFLPRRLTLIRQKISDTLGFNIRGGENYNLGIFISGVSPGSEADRLGLREGDQILEVNSHSFDSIDHAEAVSILKGSMEIYMTIRFFPYGYNRASEMSSQN